MANDISTIHSNVASPSHGTGQARRRDPEPGTAPGRPQSVEAVQENTAANQLPPINEGGNVVELTKQTQQELKEALSGLNALVQGLHRKLQFTMDEYSGDMKIQVIDKETEEVVREIPPEEIQRVRQSLAETAGIIFKDEA